MNLASKPFYRAGTLGEGGYGSVMKLFDDDGGMFAGKIFSTDSENSTPHTDSYSSSCTDSETPTLGLETGVLREMAFFASQKTMGLSHPNILSAECVTQINGEICVVLPHMERSLEDVITKAQWLSNADRLSVIKQVLCGLSHMHANGFMHRDVKSANILLDSQNNAYLADFSLVKPVNISCSSPTSKGGAKGANHTRGCGTPTYTAPEVVSGSDYGTKADSWSVGVLMLELFNKSEITSKNDKNAFKDLEVIREKLSRVKVVPVTIAGLLDPSPESRLSCAEALQKLNNAKDLQPQQVSGCKIVLPESTTPKKAKKEPMVKKAFNQLGCVSPHTMYAAERIQELTGAHPSHCVFLAHKLYELELIDGWALNDVMDGFDENAYPQSELDMLGALQFNLYGICCK